jgi:hypothetical protein
MKTTVSKENHPVSKENNPVSNENVQYPLKTRASYETQFYVSPWCLLNVTITER